MKYSFIFCYRNRETHLNITIPRIRDLHPDAEIIIVEQNDQKKFRRANLLNEGARVATGDILILHDIDYYPTDNVMYYDGTSDVFLPVKQVEFVYNTLAPKPLSEVPGGYRHFKDGVDANFFGAVEVFTREAFFTINGFSPLYVGWGFEDSDVRERIHHYGLTVIRGNGQFLALDHPDSGPTFQDQDFLNNIHRSQNWQRDLAHGVKTQPSHAEQVVPKHKEVDKWIMATEFDPPPAPTHIMVSKFNFDEGDEE
jgi:hypothetical protein